MGAGEVTLLKFETTVVSNFLGRVTPAPSDRKKKDAALRAC
jgi:hypothetical protein